jgi:hypothetical protein
MLAMMGGGPDDMTGHEPGGEHHHAAGHPG